MQRVVERARHLLGGMGAVVRDTRTSTAFGTGLHPGGATHRAWRPVAAWAGTLVKADAPIVLVDDNEESIREARTRLARVGTENVAGYLAGGIFDWNHAGLELARLTYQNRLERGPPQRTPAPPDS